MAGSLYALLVGIDAYRSPIPPLRGCVNDIEAAAVLLQELARDNALTPEFCVLKDADATRAAIIRGFQVHLKRAGASDVALFYYAGHGSQEAAPQEFWHIEPDHLDETLVCHDSRDPGNWDLADKELAALIDDVARGGTHMLCVLDCCHSGSGTRAADDEGIAVRRAPTDWRARPIDSFLPDAQAGARAAGAAAGSWAVMPVGRHVLLAACRASETAKEVIDEGRSHGAFSASLLATLRQTRGAISYRDLAKRAEAQVRLRVSQQIPQLEASNPDDLQSLFLGRPAGTQIAHFTLRYDRDQGWVIDGGAIHGVAAPVSAETTLLAIHGLDASAADLRQIDRALTTGSVTKVQANLSQVELKPGGAALDRQLTYRAITVATPLPPLAVRLSGPAAALEFVRAALAPAGGTASLLVHEATAGGAARLQVEVVDGSYRIGRVGAARALVADVAGLDAAGARRVVERLEHIARWEAVAALSNSGSRLPAGTVKITILRPEQTQNGEDWNEADDRNGLRLSYTYADDKWSKPRLRIKLTNSAQEDLYCALLWLGENFSISSGLMPGGAERIPAGRSFVLNNGNDILASVPNDKWKRGQTEVHDLIKLVVSTEQFDPRLFDQQALEAHVTRGELRRMIPRNALERLAQRVHLRDLSLTPDDDIVPEWTTGEVTLEVVRPLDAITVPPPNEQRQIGANVTLMGHPSLKAMASLGSPADAGRALGPLAVPAILRDDPAVSQPFLFERARGTDSGLSTLQLTDVQNPEAVTKDAPLRIRTAVPLGANEHVLAYAWDGSLFLPVGAGRHADGVTEIELRQLPAPLALSEDQQRGISSSIRILFQKLASPYLGTDFDYPRLAAVSFDGADEPTYDHATETVRQKVAAAQRILLYVHGILGDTFGMTASARAPVALLNAAPQRIGDRYDLVLAFDYENIHTDIAATARALKDKLAAVGLGPEHGKTLHVVAHSMGGLVSRWFIEREQGDRVVHHLVTLGTPHAGSPWPTIEGLATTALALGLNGLSAVAWPAKLLGNLVAAIETVDVTLDQMAPNSPFLATLGQSADPKVPYSLLVGNTSIIRQAAGDSVVQTLLARLAPQRVMHAATALAFFNKPNDIAVAVTSATAVPAARMPAPRITKVACDHITFFSTDAGRQALLDALEAP